MLTTIHPAEVPVYGRLQLQPESGAGSTITAADGRRFLDLYGGHAVAVSGHCHPRVVAAIREQAERLLFYSNAVPLDSRNRLFALLAEMAPQPLDQAFLVNSGAETNDVALQLARRVTGRRRVVSLEGGFHGRTLATLAASGIPHYRDLADASGGQSLLDLTVVAPWGRPELLPALVDESIAAVIVEPVQGLAGAREVGAEILKSLRRACDAAGAVLIFDEVQCGCGRTGAFTAAQSYGVTPDILTLAKGIAAGLPMGAVLLSPRIAKHVSQGDSGTTFGGGPIPCASAVANLEVIRDDGLGRPRAPPRTAASAGPRRSARDHRNHRPGAHARTRPRPPGPAGPARPLRARHPGRLRQQPRGRPPSPTTGAHRRRGRHLHPRSARGALMTPHNLIGTDEWPDDEIRSILARAAELKAGAVGDSFVGKALIMVFFNPSLRTRTSFEVAMARHGGHAVVLEPGKGAWAIETRSGVVMDGDAVEHIVEAARVLGRYGEAVAVRAFPSADTWAEARRDEVVRAFAEHAGVPTINMESARRHPCQGLADALTLQENLGERPQRPALCSLLVLAPAAAAHRRARLGSPGRGTPRDGGRGGATAGLRSRSRGHGVHRGRRRPQRRDGRASPTISMRPWPAPTRSTPRAGAVSTTSATPRPRPFGGRRTATGSSTKTGCPRPATAPGSSSTVFRCGATWWSPTASSTVRGHG